MLIDRVDPFGSPNRFSKIFPGRKVRICFGWRRIAADIVPGILVEKKVPSVACHLVEYPGDAMLGINDIVVIAIDHHHGCGESCDGRGGPDPAFGPSTERSHGHDRLDTRPHGFSSHLTFKDGGLGRHRQLFEHRTCRVVIQTRRTQNAKTAH